MPRIARQDGDLRQPVGVRMAAEQIFSFYFPRVYYTTTPHNSAPLSTNAEPTQDDKPSLFRLKIATT